MIRGIRPPTHLLIWIHCRKITLYSFLECHCGTDRLSFRYPWKTSFHLCPWRWHFNPLRWHSTEIRVSRWFRWGWPWQSEIWCLTPFWWMDGDFVTCCETDCGWESLCCVGRRLMWLYPKEFNLAQRYNFVDSMFINMKIKMYWLRVIGAKHQVNQWQDYIYKEPPWIPLESRYILITHTLNSIFEQVVYTPDMNQHRTRSFHNEHGKQREWSSGGKSCLWVNAAVSDMAYRPIQPVVVVDYVVIC